MKILIVTKELYPKNSTGLGISTHTHAQILKKNGHDVKIVSNNNELSVDYHIYCPNIFSFFSNYFSCRNKIEEIVNNFKPDLIIVESLQTVISEFFLSIKYHRKIKIVLISHGISILPYKINFKYCLRFLIYLTYLPFLFFLLKNVDIFYSLNWTNKSDRHLDEKFYMKSKKNYKIIKYFNTSRYENIKVKNNFLSKKIISCFGYVGEVKNQKDFLKIAKKFSREDVIFRIIYQSFDNNYLKKCEKFCEYNKLKKVQFINGNDVDIRDKLEESHIIVNTSITEVFPITLVEGMSMGVPFVSYDKGNISWMKGGLIAKDYFELERFVKLLINNSFFYDKISNQAKTFYTKNLSNALLEQKMKQFYFE